MFEQIMDKRQALELFRQNNDSLATMVIKTKTDPDDKDWLFAYTDKHYFYFKEFYGRIWETRKIVDGKCVIGGYILDVVYNQLLDRNTNDLIVDNAIDYKDSGNENRNTFNCFGV